MSGTWLDFAIRRDGPVSKQGYSGAPQRTLEDIEGEVKHSTEGPLLAAFGELDKLERRASWTFTIDADGTVYQHFPLESITWHCGVLGDRSVDTSLIGNLTLVGEEHVDRIGGQMLEILTSAAQASSVRITKEIRALCPRVRANPPTLRRNLWEHGWLSWTACPSGLIPWGTIIPALTVEEDDMALSPAAEKGIEDFFATPFTDRDGRAHNSKAEYVTQVLDWLDSDHLATLFAEHKAILDAIGTGPAGAYSFLKELGLKKA